MGERAFALKRLDAFGQITAEVTLGLDGLSSRKLKRVDEGRNGSDPAFLNHDPIKLNGSWAFAT